MKRFPLAQELSPSCGADYQKGGPSDLGSPAELEGLLGCVPPRPLAIVEGEAHESR